MSETSQSVRAGQFELASCQATVFTPEGDLSVPKLLKTVVPGWLDVFDGDPVVLPHAEAIPREIEIPRLTLLSKAGAWRCEFAPTRLNIHYTIAAAPEPATPTISSFLDDCTTRFQEYQRATGARIARLAVVTTRYARHDTPGRYLAGHFCKPAWLSGALNRPESFELHAHKRFTMGGKFFVNSWVRSKTGTATIAGKTDPIVLVEQDLNTLAEDLPTRAFSAADVAEFYAAAARELDHIIAMYYPEN